MWPNLEYLRRVGDDSARSFAVCADHVHFPLIVVSLLIQFGLEFSPLGCRGGEISLLQGRANVQIKLALAVTVRAACSAPRSP